MIPQVIAQAKLNKTNRFGYKMYHKIRQNEKLSHAIDEYFLLNYEMALPADRDELKAILNQEFEFNPDDKRPLHIQQQEFEEMQNFCDQFEELIKLRYALLSTRGYWAEFRQNEAKRMVPLTFWYSRNRLDEAWNMRKSQIIRNRYFTFLATAVDHKGRFLINHYLPLHLTLTLPHKDGLFKGKRFYAKELISLFAELRKHEPWKLSVYAGEYGLEIKKSKNNGLHIHLHCLILQNPEIKINDFREWLVMQWKEITGNTSSFSGLHYETLYTWERNPDGSIKTVMKDGVKVPAKKYVKPGVSSIEDYLAGVMECIKYHFKPGCLEKENGEYDIDLIHDILENTKGKRLYSRFGAFYKQPLLNFNRLEKETEDLTETETEEEVLASAEGVEERLINPFTLQPASREDYQIVVGKPQQLRYYDKDSATPYEPYAYRHATALHVCDPLPLKEIIRMHAIRKNRKKLY